MIYYLHPYIDAKTPTGGILKIFEHIKILSKNGIEAKAVYYTDKFINNPDIEMADSITIELKWAGIKINSISIKKLIKKINRNDSIIIPEIRPHLINFFLHIKNRIIFIQNWHKIKPKKFSLKRNQTYEKIGYNYVITCSDFLTRYVSRNKILRNGGNHKSGNIPVFTVNNSVEPKIFYKDDKKRIPNRIIMLNRKGKKFIKKIIKKTKNLNYDFIIINKHISQKQLADEFRKSDIYIHTGFPEGFGLPVLEAQLCGAVSIGFTGGGANELMIHNKTSLIAKDGDVKSIIKYLILLKKHPELKEKFRKEGYKIASQHSPKYEETKLLNVFYKIL